MKTPIKLLLTGLIITLSMSTYSYHTDKVCSNDNVTIEVLFDQAPRGGDLVKLGLSDGTDILFYTKFTSLDLSTRCGIAKSHKTSLYLYNSSTQAKGNLSVYVDGADCGHKQCKCIH